MSEGLLAQIRAQKPVTIDYTITYDQLTKLFQDLWDRPIQRPITQLPAWYARTLNDEDFIILCKSDIHLVGGFEDYTAVKERMKRLNIVE